MKKVIYTSIFLSLFLWACSTQVENRIHENRSPASSSESIVDAESVNSLTIEELRFKVKETKDQINQLDQQLDQLLKEI